MSEQPEQFETSEVTSDDKLWAALAYAIPVLIPVVILLMEDKKNRPFIRAHNVQALVLGVIFWILATFIAPTIVGLCLMPLIWIGLLYLAYKAYQGEYVTIPILTDFVKKQGWA
jgi:uncharacterized protein